jgi:hypothetical protein
MTDTPTTSLTVGPLRVIVEAIDPAVHTALRAAYRAFVVDDAPVSHTLRVQIAYTPGPAPADWPFTFDEGILRFTAPHCTGSIDARRLAAHADIIAPHPFEPIDYLVRAALALLAFEAGGLLFHAAGLARRGAGYGFFGHSGSGKTTVARVSIDAIILNDDLVVLLPEASHPAARQASRPLEETGARTREADRWAMAATPFSNPTQVSPIGPQTVPLAALYRLVQDRSVFVEPIEPAAAIAEVIASSPVVNADPDRAVGLLARAEHIARQVPVGRLHFLPDSSFWAVVQP